MSTAERNGILAPAEGLTIYNTDDNTFYVWSSASGTAQWDALVISGNRLDWLTEGNVDLVDGTDNFLGTTDGTPVRVITNGTERMIVEADGDVGFNTTPNAKTQVQIVGDNGEVALRVEDNGANDALVVVNNGAGNAITTTGNIVPSANSTYDPSPWSPRTKRNDFQWQSQPYNQRALLRIGLYYAGSIREFTKATLLHREEKSNYQQE